MAKKWKLGKKYQLKCVTGYNAVGSINEQISDILGDRVFEIVREYGENSFFIVNIEGEHVVLPFEISDKERKFFKRID